MAIVSDTLYPCIAQGKWCELSSASFERDQVEYSVWHRGPTFIQYAPGEIRLSFEYAGLREPENRHEEFTLEILRDFFEGIQGVFRAFAFGTPLEFSEANRVQELRAADLSGELTGGHLITDRFEEFFILRDYLLDQSNLGPRWEEVIRGINDYERRIQEVKG